MNRKKHTLPEARVFNEQDMYIPTTGDSTGMLTGRFTSTGTTVHSKREAPSYPFLPEIGLQRGKAGPSATTEASPQEKGRCHLSKNKVTFREEKIQLC